jgi:cytochrome c biogenesis factor
MNPLVGGNPLGDGPFLFGMVLIHAAAYTAVTVAFGMGLLALRPPKDSAFDFHLEVVRWIRIGFLLLSSALILQCTWTTFAWGEFWVWDPVKSFSLLAWLVYAGILHMHHVPTYRGRAVVLANLWGWGFLFLTFLGTMLMDRSLLVSDPGRPNSTIHEPGTTGRSSP